MYMYVCVEMHLDAQSHLDFALQLFSLMDSKPPISRAKMISITKSAIKAIKVSITSSKYESVKMNLKSCKAAYALTKLVKCVHEANAFLCFVKMVMILLVLLQGINSV